jgi:hypothetical protein
MTLPHLFGGQALAPSAGVCLRAGYRHFGPVAEQKSHRRFAPLMDTTDNGVRRVFRL